MYTIVILVSPLYLITNIRIIWDILFVLALAHVYHHTHVLNGYERLGVLCLKYHHGSSDFIGFMFLCSPMIAPADETALDTTHAYCADLSSRHASTTGYLQRGFTFLTACPL